jgi:hypothetical protein
MKLHVAYAMLAVLFLSRLPAAAQSCPSLPALSAEALAQAVGGSPGNYNRFTQVDLSPGGQATEDQPYGTSFATDTIGSQSMVSANASGLNSDASGTLIYYMEACGPDATATLIMSGSVAASASIGSPQIGVAWPSASGSAGLTVGPVTGPNNNTFLSYLVNLYDFQSLQNFEGNVTTDNAQSTPTSLPDTLLDVPANTLLEVLLSAGASGTLGSASASVDPTFELDPGDPDSADFTLAFSPGITSGGPPVTSTSVPEPGSLPLLLASLCMFGIAHRLIIRHSRPPMSKSVSATRDRNRRQPEMLSATFISPRPAHMASI